MDPPLPALLTLMPYPVVIAEEALTAVLQTGSFDDTLPVIGGLNPVVPIEEGPGLTIVKGRSTVRVYLVPIGGLVPVVAPEPGSDAVGSTTIEGESAKLFTPVEQSLSMASVNKVTRADS